MAQYKVWVSNPEGDGGRVELMDTDDQAKAAGLVTSLLASSGSTSYDVGVSGVKVDPQSPVPTQPAQPAQTQRPAAPPAAPPQHSARK